MAEKKKTATNKKNQKAVKNKKIKKNISPVKLEVILICIVFLCIFAMISVYLNGGGIIGNALSSVFKGLFGIGGYLLPIAFIMGCIVIFVSEEKKINAYKLLMSIGLFIFIISFTHLLTSMPNENVLTSEDYIKLVYANGSFKNGGLIGAVIGDFVAMLISKIGAFLIFVLGSACLIVLITEKSLFQVLKKIAEKFLNILSFEKPNYDDYVEEDEEEIQEEQEKKEQEKKEQEENELISEEKQSEKDESKSKEISNKKIKLSIADFFKKIIDKFRQKKVTEVKMPDFIEINKESQITEEKQPVKMFFDDVKAEINYKKENEEYDIKSMNKKPPEIPSFLNPQNRVVVKKDGTVDIVTPESSYYERNFDIMQTEKNGKKAKSPFIDIESDKYGDEQEVNIDVVSNEIEPNAFSYDEALPKQVDYEYEYVEKEPIKQETQYSYEEKRNGGIIFEDIKINKYSPNNIDYALFGMGSKGHVEIPEADANNVPKSDISQEEKQKNYEINEEDLNEENLYEIASDESISEEEKDTFFDDVDKMMADVLNSSNFKESEKEKNTSLVKEKEILEDIPTFEIEEEKEILEDIPPFEIEEEKEELKNNQPFEIKEVKKTIVDNSIKVIQPEKTRILKKNIEKEDYEYIYPKLEFLKINPELHSENDEVELRDNARKLVETLASFKVEARVINISQGPTVTRYEITVAEGTKLSKVSDLSDNLALSLAAVSVRIEAPIPGKSAVGIEIPNKNVKSVYLSEVICSEKFQKFNSRTAFAIGKDITGNVIVEDIEKMPHLLIAGATGAGKSVCINTLIMSLIYKSSPKEVRLIMVDPKVVELASYEDIPHLLIPVVTDPNKAAGALNWAVKEMMERYNMFKMTKTRNIGGYNEIAEKNGFEKMSHIVIIVDELADLMMVAKKEVESAICRLAQLARAAGIHLVIATQRPSTDVITGLIKANIPSRIAFKTSNGIDSRTILDAQGAEKLIGRGDMLLKTVRMDKPLRIQCAFVSDEEVENIVEYIKENNPCEYDESIINEIEEGSCNDDSGSSSSSDISDPLTEEVISFLIQQGKASTSSIQRRFRIGYNRAARIIEELEDRGIVGKENGSKFRDVLMDKYQYEEYLDNRSNY